MKAAIVLVYLNLLLRNSFRKLVQGLHSKAMLTPCKKQFTVREHSQIRDCNFHPSNPSTMFVGDDQVLVLTARCTIFRYCLLVSDFPLQYCMSVSHTSLGYHPVIHSFTTRLLTRKNCKLKPSVKACFHYGIWSATSLHSTYRSLSFTIARNAQRSTAVVEIFF